MYRMGGGKRRKPNAEEEQQNILELPSAIILDILLRLPVRTAVHCSSVCKAWRTLVLDPCFPQIHLANANAKSSVSLMLCTTSLRYNWLIEFDHQSNICKRKIWSKPKLDSNEYNGPIVVGSCNGLICLTAFFRRQYYVWNPVKNDYVNLPGPNLINPMGIRVIMRSGFGFCPRTNVYKVIRMVTDYGNDMPLSMSNKKARCEVYTLGTNAWRTIEDVPIPYLGNTICKMSINGAVHWLSSFKINDEATPPLWVCAFRIEDEKWDPILLPHPLRPSENILDSFLELGVLENCLAVFDIFLWGSSLDIWMMKDYGVRESWTKCWSVEQDLIPSQLDAHSLRPLKLTNDGDLLMFDSYSRAFACFDPQKGLVTKKPSIGVRKRCCEHVVFVESFISPTEIMKGGGSGGAKL